MTSARGRLDLLTDNASGWHGPDPAWAALEWLRARSSIDRQRVCLTDALGPDGVTVSRVDGSASFTAAKPCGVRSCPKCGPREAGQRRSEVSDLFGRAVAAGWSVRFLTLTLRHSSADALSDTLDALLAAWRALTSSGWWARLRKRHGVRGTLRVIECVWGEENGWHPHLHVLLFVEPVGEADDMGALFLAVVMRWQAVVRAQGFTASVDAQDMRDVRPGDIDRISGYVTKEATGTAPEDSGDAAERMAWEVTGERTKRRKKLVPAAVLLERAVAGDEAAAALFVEYERATRGRRLWEAPRAAFRQAVAAATPVGARKPPEAPPEPVRERLALVSRDEYRELARRRGLRGATAQIVDNGGDAGEVVWFLHDHGITARPVVPDFPPETPGGAGLSASPGPDPASALVFDGELPW